jgi:tetratricopeptide (TPR) repeat protein
MRYDEPNEADEGGAQGLLAHAREAARLGRRAQAQRLYEQAIFVDPEAEQAWLELARVVEDPVLSRALYLRILGRWPASLEAAQALAALEDGEHAAAEPLAEAVPVQDPVERMAMDIARAGAPIYRGLMVRRRRRPCRVWRVRLRGTMPICPALCGWS